MLYQVVVIKIEEFTQRESAIRKNGDLSAAGQKKARDLLTAEILAYRPRALQILGDDVTALRARFTANESARATAQNQAEGAWDYQRLNYHAALVRQTVARLAGANSPGIKQPAEVLLAKEWDQAKAYGDKTKMRAWAEFGSDELLKAFPSDQNIALLVKTMRDELANMLYTPALKSVDQAGEALADEAMNLIVAVLKAAKFFYASDKWNTMFSGTDPLTKLLDNISVSTEYLGEAGFKVNVTVDEISLAESRPFAMDDATRMAHSF
jgi:hypothetical protein